jgi:PAS domain S-box-containing protein
MNIAVDQTENFILNREKYRNSEGMVAMDEKMKKGIIKEIGMLKHTADALDIDRSEMRKMILKHKKEAENFKILIQHTDQLIALFDENGVCEFVNEASLTRLGKTLDEMIGKTMWDFFPKKYADAQMESVGDAIRSQCMRFFDAKTIMMNTEMWVEVRIIPVESAVDQNKRAAFIIAADISERKAADEKLRKKVKELEAALSHINTLEGLIPICMNCKKIRMEEGNPKDQESWKNIEEYISATTEANLSHGVCPECAKKLLKKQFDPDEYNI